MKRATVLLLSLMLLAACDRFRAPPADPEGEMAGQMSREKILAETRPLLEPLRNVLTTQTPMSNAQHSEVLQALTDAKLKYGSTESGEEAFWDLGREIVQIARDAASDNRWRLALVCVDAHDILGLSSVSLSRLDDRAKERMAQPKVTVRGFLEDQEMGETHVFLELLDRQTNEITKRVFREGEEFDNLRLVEIIGANNKVRFEYLPIKGLYFEVEFKPTRSI